MSLYLGTNLISGVATPVEGARNIGQIVQSTIPLTDAGLHLLDGALIQGSGSYADFVDYIADLYNSESPTISYVKGSLIALPTFTSNTQDGITIADARNNTTTLQAIFNGTNRSNQIGTWSTYWISIDYGQNTILSSYTIQADNNGSPEYPSAWVVQGSNDGSTWVDIDSRTGITFSLNEIKTFSVSTSTRYSQYKIVFSNGVQSSNNGEMKQFKFNAYTPISVIENSIFATEEWWQHSVTTYGVCGKFVYDSVNNTVRLPKYSDKFWSGGGVANAKGNDISLGLTDGTYNFGMAFGTIGAGNTIQVSDSYGQPVGANTGVRNGYLGGVAFGITTDGTKSGIIADLSTITTALDGYWYIVLATSTKTQIEVDIDEIATDLNGKADVDLGNINPSQTVKNTIVGWGMPDYSAGITKSATSYTETMNGFIVVDYTTDTYSQFRITIDGVEFRFYQGYSGTDYNHCNVGFVPIPKGKQYTINDMTNCRVRFFPCIGE